MPDSLRLDLRRCCLIAHQGPSDREEPIKEHLSELAELARSCGFAVVAKQRLKRATIAAKTFYGSGQLEAVADEAARLGATVLICDDELSGSQVNAIEKITRLACLDRTGLILSIFEQRAQSREARAQVELARYEYELPRLKGAWTHLERQGGGVGLRGGPGETQIEVDRRMIRTRISQLKKELIHLEKVRETQRLGRPSHLPRIALVGYTNAGKTSLLRALTGTGEPQDLLFATLDTTTRKAWLGHDMNLETGEPTGEVKHCLVADTVGFIRKLPHQLVAAFRSTLSEVLTADALLIVADGADPDLEDRLRVVADTLRDIGCLDDHHRQPRLLVLNQVDRLHRPQKLDLKRKFPHAAQTVAISGQGLDEVRTWIRELIPGPMKPQALEWWEVPEAKAPEFLPPASSLLSI